MYCLTYEYNLNAWADSWISIVMPEVASPRVVTIKVQTAEGIWTEELSYEYQ